MPPLTSPAHKLIKRYQRAEDRLLTAWANLPVLLRVVLLLAATATFFAVTFLPEEHGLQRAMWAGEEAQGAPEVVAHDDALDFDAYRLRADLPAAREMTVQWTGWIRIPETATYDFEAAHDGSLQLAIDDRDILHSVSPSPSRVTAATRVRLNAGTYPFRLSVSDPGGSTHVVLKWGSQEPLRVAGGSDFARTSEALDSWMGYMFRQYMWWGTFLLLFFFLALELAGWNWARVESALQGKQWRITAVFGILLIGLAVRLYVLFSSGFMTIADEAIVGVMGMHILEGRGLPVLFYGQYYGGALESYLAVPLFALFGVAPAILKLVPLCLSLALIPLVHVLARRFTNETGALLAALYLAIPPMMPLLYSLMAMIGPVEIAVLGAFYLWMLLRVVQADTPHPRDEFLLGLAAGLGIWVNAQIFYYLVAGELVLLLYRRPQLSRFWWPCWGTAGLFLGLYPLLYYSFFTDWVPFKHLGGSVGETRYGYALFHNLFGQGIPVLLGGRPRWALSEDLYLPPLPMILYATFAISVVAVWVRAIRRRSAPFIFLALALVLIPAIYINSSYGSLLNAPPRYIFTMLPLVPLVLVAFLGSLARHSRLLLILLLLVFAAVHARGIFTEDPHLFFQHEADIADGRLLPENNRTLIQELDARGISAFSTDFWIGWNVSLESRESLVHDDWLDRYPPYHRRFLETDRPAWVFHNNEQRGEWQIDGLEELFDLVGYEAMDVPPYRVFLPPAPVQPRGKWEAYGSVNSVDSFKGVDGDINAGSAWRSGVAQQAGQFFLVDTHESVPRDRVVFHWGPNPWDAPQSAHLLVSPDGTSWSDPIELVPTERLNGAWADLGGQPVRMLKIELTADAPGRPWAIYDVFVGKTDLN